MSQKGYELPTEVTVCAMFHEEWDCIAAVLEPLAVQGLRLDVLTAFDPSGNDPTRDVLQSPRLKSWMECQSERQVRTYRCIGEIPHRPHVDDTLAFAKRAFVEEVVTPYVFFIDGDIRLDPGTIHDVLLAFKRSKRCGAMAVRYSVTSSHEQWGAILMRTDVAKKIGFSGRAKDGKAVCGCIPLKEDLEKNKLKFEAWKGGSAFHMKWLTRVRVQPANREA